MSSEYLRRWRFLFFQRLTSFWGEGRNLNIYSEFPFLPVLSVVSQVIIVYLWERFVFACSTLFHCIVLDSSKISPEFSPLKFEQRQLPWPSFVCHELQAPDHPYGPVVVLYTICFSRLCLSVGLGNIFSLGMCPGTIIIKHGDKTWA